MKCLGFLVLLTLILNACSRMEADPVREYLALAPAEVNDKVSKRIQAFTELYSQLDNADLDNRITQVYAEKFYFNDTLVTISDRSNLLRYMKHTQAQLESLNFHVLSVQESAGEAYVRWLMETRFSTLGQHFDIRSIGISHLRFNGANKIILHQDYWDSTQGLFLHLPVIGGVLRWLKSNFQNF